MSILLPVMGMALAACCVWSAARIVRLRKKWVIRARVGLLVLLTFLFAYSNGWLLRAKPGNDAVDVDWSRAIRRDPFFAFVADASGRPGGGMAETQAALAAYSRAIQCDPRNAGAFFARGLARAEQRQYEKAIADFTEVIRLKPKHAGAYCCRGQALALRREFGEALADFTEAILLDSTCAEFYLERGRVLSEKREDDGAMADFTQAILLNPENASAWYCRGIVWHEKQDLEKAIADYTEAIRLYPQHAWAYLNRGSARRNRRAYEMAIADYREAIRLDPSDDCAYRNLASLLATCFDPRFRDGRQAVEYATKACELTEWKDARNLDNLAAAYAEVGQFADAIETQQRALDLAASSEKSHFRLHLKLYRAGQPLRKRPPEQRRRQRAAGTFLY